jgi:uncharacterized protein
MIERSQALDISHAARIEALIAPMATVWGAHCLSEYAFANLWLFRREHQYRFTDGDWPVISGLTYDGMHHAMPLFELATAPDAVIDGLLCRHDGLYPLPAAVAQRFDRGRYTLSANRDDADYLYPADHFRHYRGRLLSKKRNLMKQLLREHQVQAEPFDRSWAGPAQKVLSGWMHDKNKAQGSADELACLDVLTHAQSLGFTGFGYLVDGEPGGFILAEALAPGVLVVRFAKSREAFKGLAQYMFHHLCTHGPVDLAWLNFEQDLGLPNFRQTKQSYRPVALLNKWRVRRT